MSFKRSTKMIDGREKNKIRSKFAKRAARYNDFGRNSNCDKLYNIQVLGGNIDLDTPVYHYLHPPIHAKYLRFLPKTWKSHFCMRVEAYGCQKCKYLLQ